MAFVEGLDYPIDKGNDCLLSRMGLSKSILVIIQYIVIINKILHMVVDNFSKNFWKNDRTEIDH